MKNTNRFLWIRDILFTLPFSLALLCGAFEAKAMVVWDWDPTLQTLNGAQNVNVNGTLYDVAFIDGSCVEIFDGCDDPVDDFTFHTLDGARAASNALLDQVFLDIRPLFLSPADFDSNPALTNGCSTPLICNVFTAFDLAYDSALHARITNGNGIADARSPDRSFQELKFLAPVGTYGDSTYAVWSLSTPVPVPAAIWLFCTGVIGLVGFSKLNIVIFR